MVMKPIDGVTCQQCQAKEAVNSQVKLVTMDYLKDNTKAFL